MKKILQITALVLVTTSYSFADSAYPASSVGDWKDFKDEVQGRTFVMSGNLVNDWLDLKAEMLTMCANGLKSIGELNFKKLEDQEKYNEAAKAMKNAAAKLGELPVNKIMKKSFKDVGAWMNLHLDKMRLKGRTLKNLARQLKSKRMARKGDRLMRVADRLQGRLEKATTRDIEKLEKRAGKLARVAGRLESREVTALPGVRFVQTLKESEETAEKLSDLAEDIKEQLEEKCKKCQLVPVKADDKDEDDEDSDD